MAAVPLGVVRRWLEKNKRPGQRVVFVLDTADLELYKQIMPLYFPRSRAEEQAALAELPQDIGEGGQRGRPSSQLASRPWPPRRTLAASRSAPVARDFVPAFAC